MQEISIILQYRGMALRCIVCYAKIKGERMTCVKLRIGVPTIVERSFAVTFKGLAVDTAPILRLRGTLFVLGSD